MLLNNWYAEKIGSWVAADWGEVWSKEKEIHWKQWAVSGGTKEG